MCIRDRSYIWRKRDWIIRDSSRGSFTWPHIFLSGLCPKWGGGRVWFHGSFQNEIKTRFTRLGGCSTRKRYGRMVEKQLVGYFLHAWGPWLDHARIPGLGIRIGSAGKGYLDMAAGNRMVLDKSGDFPLSFSKFLRKLVIFTWLRPKVCPSIRFWKQEVDNPANRMIF